MFNNIVRSRSVQLRIGRHRIDLHHSDLNSHSRSGSVVERDVCIELFWLLALEGKS